MSAIVGAPIWTAALPWGNSIRHRFPRAGLRPRCERSLNLARSIVDSIRFDSNRMTNPAPSAAIDETTIDCSTGRATGYALRGSRALRLHGNDHWVGLGSSVALASSGYCVTAVHGKRVPGSICTDLISSLDFHPGTCFFLMNIACRRPSSRRETAKNRG